MNDLYLFGFSLISSERYAGISYGFKGSISNLLHIYKTDSFDNLALKYNNKLSSDVRTISMGSYESLVSVHVMSA